MAGVFKCTFIFEGKGKGWTESYWYNSTTEDHVKMEGPCTRFAEKRANCLGTEAFIKAFRISKESEGPDARLVYKVFKPGVVQLNQVGEVAISSETAMPDVALMMRCNDATSSKHKLIFMRGIPDRIEITNGVYNKDLRWGAVLGEFVKELTRGKWGWMGVKTTTKVAKVPLVNYEFDTKGRVTFSFRDNLFPLGLAGKLTKVRIAGVNKKSPINTVHIVRVQDQKVAQTYEPFAAGPYVSGGYGTWSELEFIGIDDAQDTRIVSRKAGAPLLESRGRAKARAKF